MAHVSVNTASTAQLNAGIDAVTTTIVLSGPTFTGWPSTFPYWAIIARGTSVAEIVEVTAGTGATLTATRGRDGTVAAPHNTGDTFEHIIPADTANRAEQHIDATAAHGATGAIVGTTNAQTITKKLYQGGHKHVFTDTDPAGLSAGFESVADNASARDGFVHNNTSGDNDRRGFLLAQSGTPRFEAFNDGTLKVSPNGSATRKGIETTTSLKCGTTLEVGTTSTLTGNATIGGTLGVTGAATLSNTLGVTGNSTIGGTLGVTGATSLSSVSTTGNASVGGTLAVTGTSSHTGASTFASSVTAYGTGIPVPTVGSSFPSSPVTDQLFFRISDGCWSRWDGTAWQVVDDLGGRRAIGAGAINSGITTTETQIGKLDFTSVPLVNGRSYELKVTMRVFTSVNNDAFLIRIRRGSVFSTGSGLMTDFQFLAPANTTDSSWTFSDIWPSNATEVTNFYVSVQRVAGSGSLNVYGDSRTSFWVNELASHSNYLSVS